MNAEMKERFATNWMNRLEMMDKEELEVIANVIEVLQKDRYYSEHPPN